MFSYCEESPLTINIMIGQFISHELEWIDEKGNFVTIEKVNQWNRHEMAIEFFEWRYQNYLSKFGDIKNKEKFLLEVAIKIDQLLPSRFFVKYHQYNSTIYKTKDGTILRKYFNGIDKHEETKGLICQFPRNKENCTNTFKSDMATDKQFNYLSYLAFQAGYTGIIDRKNISLKKASELISFLKGEREKPKDLSKYLYL